VNTFHAVHVVLWELVVGRWVFEEEGVVGVAGWVLLRLEEGVKVPEGGVYVTVCGHFGESNDIVVRGFGYCYGGLVGLVRFMRSVCGGWERRGMG
jgi:hypothetical protein